MSKLERITLIFISIFLIIGIALSYIDRSFFEKQYIVEDGFIESLTVLALLLGSILCFYRFKILFFKRKKIFLLCTFLLGALFLFGAGEEISWGQRIFNVESSSFFHKYNSQQETNLHNLIVQGKKINKIIFGTGLGILMALYLLFLPLLYRKTAIVKKVINHLACPVPQIYQTIGFLILFGFVNLTNSNKKGELMEFGGCFLFLLITYMPFNKHLFKKI